TGGGKPAVRTAQSRHRARSPPVGTRWSSIVPTYVNRLDNSWTHRRNRLGLLDHGRARPVREAVEDARGEQSLASGERFLGRVELDLDEDLVRILPVAEEPVASGRAAGAREILVEHRLP